MPDGDPWTVLLGRIDPAEWPQIFGGDLLALIAGGSEELIPLYPGFRQAAITFRHAGVAQVLVAGTLARGDRKNPPTVDAALWEVLNPTDAIAMLDRLLGHQSVRPDQVAAAAQALPRPWPAALARRFARWLPTGGQRGCARAATAVGSVGDRRRTAGLPGDGRPRPLGDRGGHRGPWTDADHQGQQRSQSAHAPCRTVRKPLRLPGGNQ